MFDLRVGICFAVFAGVLGFAGPLLAQATTAASLDFMLRACIETAPTFARTKALVIAAGGTGFSNPTMQSLNTQLDEPRFIGLWHAPRPHTKDWLVGLAEGHWGAYPARSCFVAPGRAKVPEVVSAINARWTLTSLGPPRPGLIFNTRHRYRTRINGADAIVVLNWSGERASSTPYVTVITMVHSRKAAICCLVAVSSFGSDRPNGCPTPISAPGARPDHRRSTGCETPD